MNENTIRFLSILRLERELNKNMREFNLDVMITLSDITKKITKEERESYYQIIDIIDRMNGEKNDTRKQTLG